MEQLNIQDAGFLYQETEKTPMHIGGFAIFDQSKNKHKRLDRQGTIDYITARITKRQF